MAEGIAVQGWSLLLSEAMFSVETTYEAKVLSGSGCRDEHTMEKGRAETTCVACVESIGGSQENCSVRL